MARFSTVGHSTRTLETFTALLRGAGVDVVVDVRSFPRSRSNPAYNIDTLPDRLAERQIGYRHIPALGGRRGRQPGVPTETNAGWRNPNLHNYADYTLSRDFGRALTELTNLGHTRHVAIMCAEASWWRCHRRIIADHLILAGHEVMHLMDLGKETVAKPTPGARTTKDRLVVYPEASE